MTVMTGSSYQDHSPHATFTVFFSRINSVEGGVGVSLPASKGSGVTAPAVSWLFAVSNSVSSRVGVGGYLVRLEWRGIKRQNKKLRYICSI